MLQSKTQKYIKSKTIESNRGKLLQIQSLEYCSSVVKKYICQSKTIESNRGKLLQIQSLEYCSSAVKKYICYSQKPKNT